MAGLMAASLEFRVAVLLVVRLAISSVESLAGDWVVLLAAPTDVVTVEQTVVQKDAAMAAGMVSLWVAYSVVW